MKKYEKIDRPEILQFIFFPRKEEKSPLPGNAFDVDIEVDQDTFLACRFYMADKDSPNILYFHGNGETVNDHNEIGYMYNKNNMNLLVVTYRGYGASTGSPTVSTLMKDSKTIYDYSTSWLKDNGYNAGLFVMGRSLGSASAIELASNEKLNFKGLIIESGFAEILPLAKSLGIDVENEEFSEEEGFNNIGKIRNIIIPTFILHGLKDSLIPVAEAEKLQSYSGARSKQFQVIPGADHNTMISTGGDMYFQAIKNFIDTLLGVNNWRKRRKSYKKDSG